VAQGALAIVHMAPRVWPGTLADPELAPVAGLVRADLPQDRALAALAAIELHERGLRARVAPRPLGRVASRRALAGLDPSGAAGVRARRLARGLIGGPDERPTESD